MVVDTQKLKKFIIDDYSEVGSGVSLIYLIDTARSLEIDTSAFDNIVAIYPMSELDKSLEDLGIDDAKKIITSINEGKVKINTEDKFITRDSEDNLSSTSEDLGIAVQKIGKEVADKIVSQVEADSVGFDKLYDSYFAGAGMDKQ